MIRFRWLPACLLAMLMTGGICLGQASCPKPAQSAGSTRTPYYYELADFLFQASQLGSGDAGTQELRVGSDSSRIDIFNTDNQDESADTSDDEATDYCCSDCAAEWIPILVNDCLKTWALLWELGSYREAANLADEAWRLDPCNIATMHARTLSHLANALNVSPTGECPAQACCPKATLKLYVGSCGGFGVVMSGPTGPAPTCALPCNACGMACAQATGCCTGCQPTKPTACGTCSECSGPCAGSTCATTECCEQPTACGTCGTSPCSTDCGHGCCAPCTGSPCTNHCPKSTACHAACGECCSAKANCCEAKCCTKNSCACAKDSCCCSKNTCAKDCKCSTGGKCCCAKNTCACSENMCVLIDQIIALVKERESRPANVVVMPPCPSQQPMMGMPGMCVPPPPAPGMCVPPAPMAPAGQPVCMPGMPCPGLPVSRPMEAMPVPQPMRAPLPAAPHWVVGEVLPNPPVIQVRRDDVKIHVTSHGKRVHVNCNTFDATCDSLTTCEGGERMVLEGNVRLTMQTGNKPGKVAAERVEVYVPEGSIELIPDSTTEKPMEPVRYQCNPMNCPVCPPAYYLPN